MRRACILAAILVLKTTDGSANAGQGDPPPQPPPEEEREDPVAEDARPEPHTVPEPEWVPISNSTDYGGAVDSPSPEPPTSEHHWYGWQTLTVDALSIGAFATLAADSDAGGYLGLGGYLLGGPIVHSAHGHTEKALGSLGLRLGAPLVGAAVGTKAEDCSTREEEDFCGLAGFVVGLMIGATFAIVVDAAVLAHEDVEPEELPEPDLGLRVRPDIALSKDRAVLQLSGVF